MRTPKDTSDPAFPLQDAAAWQYGGMSLRDYFAGQALAGIMANNEVDNLGLPASVYGPPAGTWVDKAAQMAYALANAMLAEREKAK